MTLFPWIRAVVGIRYTVVALDHVTLMGDAASVVWVTAATVTKLIRNAEPLFSVMTAPSVHVMVRMVMNVFVM